MVTEIHSHGPLRINEIMTSNGGALGDESGATPDWVEIANVGQSAVNLKGYVLARNSKAGNVFVFPDMRQKTGSVSTRSPPGVSSVSVSGAVPESSSFAAPAAARAAQLPVV